MPTSVADPPASPPVIQPLLLTAAEAAAVLSLKPYQVDQLRREGKLKARVTGGTPSHPRGFRYRREDLEAYVRSLPATAAPAGGEA